MGEVRTFRVRAEEAGSRLDQLIVAQAPDLSRSRVQALIGEGRVTVEGVVRKASSRVRAGETVCLEIPPRPPVAFTPEAIPLEIVYEDEAVIVLNKPCRMVVHPASGHRTGTLIHGLLAHAPELSGIGSVQRPGIVHRLDKGTSGLLMVAKSDAAYQGLSRQLKARTVLRRYLALVWGRLPRDEGVMEGAIARHPRDRKRMAVVPAGGKPAVTRYRVVERFQEMSYIECRLQTGRTHQIRVHMAHVGHPVVGDDTYGRWRQIKDPSLRDLISGLGGFALHAATLGFSHPLGGQWLEFDAPLPAPFAQLLAYLMAVRR